MLEQEAVYLVIEALHTKAYGHPVFHSHHEAYGVISEELNKEYFDEVCKHEHENAGCREELADIAAAAIKALTQLCTED